MYSTLSLVHNGKAVKSYLANSGMEVTNECVGDCRRHRAAPRRPGQPLE
ncbi:hypothetical protein [Streptomyces sp. NPDC006510]